MRRPLRPAASRDRAAGRAAAAHHADGVRVLQRHPSARAGLIGLLVLGIDTATWTAAVGVVRDGEVLAEGDRAATSARMAARCRGSSSRCSADAGLAIGDVDGARGLDRAGLVHRAPRSGSRSRRASRSRAGCRSRPCRRSRRWHGSPRPRPGDAVCAALDARKREVYAALFERDARTGLVRETPDEALAPDGARRAARAAGACWSATRSTPTAPMLARRRAARACRSRRTIRAAASSRGSAGSASRAGAAGRSGPARARLRSSTRRGAAATRALALTTVFGAY